MSNLVEYLRTQIDEYPYEEWDVGWNAAMVHILRYLEKQE